jgi:hypothetical protein
MTLPWRRLALKKLLDAQERSGYLLVSQEELDAIAEEWNAHDA